MGDDTIRSKERVRSKKRQALQLNCSQPAIQEVPRPRTIAFVDYEYWYISLMNGYGLKPNIIKWASEIKERYSVTDIRFYGDFSRPEYENELKRIREVSYQIIYTHNAASFKKDFTDFVILDGIYQTLLFHNIYDTYILFTGDGHFCPITSCLRDKCNKNVVVYGVRDTFSSGLKKVCNSWVELPSDEEIDSRYIHMILSNLEYLEQKNSVVKPTFRRTVEVVSERNNVERELIKGALVRLLDNSYIEERELHIGLKRTITGLVIDWDKLKKDAIWPVKE